jgi:hypothetical protein
MFRKRILKFALIVPAIAGLCVLMAGTPDLSVKAKNKTVLLAASEEGKVVVDKTVHDFGTIKKEDGKMSAVFTLTNNTDAAVLISGVRASCGCTAPNWTKEPIEAGKTGTVTATYTPSASGPFEKSVTITVTEGDKTETIVVKIRGTVTVE